MSKDWDTYCRKTGTALIAGVKTVFGRRHPIFESHRQFLVDDFCVIGNMLFEAVM